ncbi:MAG: hypothetical protein WD827_03850 [Solirubrobacterales bacterium]
MLPRHSRHPAVPVAISGLVLVVAQLHGHIEVVLPVVPLLLLVVSLLVGIYPGCETIVRLAERGGLRRRRRSAPSQARPAGPNVPMVSGGLLIAFGLAQRPPPLAA